MTSFIILHLELWYFACLSTGGGVLHAKTLSISPYFQSNSPLIIFLAITFQLFQIFNSNSLCLFILTCPSVFTKTMFHDPLFLELFLFVHFTCHNQNTVNTWPEVTIVWIIIISLHSIAIMYQDIVKLHNQNTFPSDCVAMVMVLRPLVGWNISFVCFHESNI